MVTAFLFSDTTPPLPRLESRIIGGARDCLRTGAAQQVGQQWAGVYRGFFNNAVMGWECFKPRGVGCLYLIFTGHRAYLFFMMTATGMQLYIIEASNSSTFFFSTLVDENRRMNDFYLFIATL